MRVESGRPSGAKLKNTRKCEGLTSDEAARVLALMKDAKTESVAIDAIRPNPRNARRHPPKQIATLAENIRQFGFTVPVLADEHGEILAGHGRHAAARLLGLPEILVIRLTHLNSAEKRALALADNKIAELGRWDPDQLKETLALLVDPSLELSFNLDITGFDAKEIHTILHRQAPRQPDAADQLPSAGPYEHQTVTRLGDLWLCGKHALVCENPLEIEFNDVPAVAAFVDPFPGMAQLNSEEMAGNMLAWSRQIVAQLCPGARIYWFTDWQNTGVLTEAVQPVVGSPRDMIVWAAHRPSPLHLGAERGIARTSGTIRGEIGTRIGAPAGSLWHSWSTLSRIARHPAIACSIRPRVRAPL